MVFVGDGLEEGDTSLVEPEADLEGLAVGVGVTVGVKRLPLSQTNFFPDFMHVNFLP